MPTNRRRRVRELVDRDVPAWAVRLVNERVAPREGGAGFDQYFGWMFCDEAVLGLLASDSPEGRRLWSDVPKPMIKPPRAKPVRRPAGARRKPAQGRGAAGP